MLFLSFLSPVADGFISSSRLSPRLWSQSLSFERKHQSSKQWPKRPRSRSSLEVVSIYLASFRCKLHCPCRITHGQQRFCQVLWMYCPAIQSRPTKPNSRVMLSKAKRSWPIDGDGAPRATSSAPDTTRASRLQSRTARRSGCHVRRGEVRVTPRLQPAYPRRPFRTIRSRPRYASSRSRDSQPCRLCPRV